MTKNKSISIARKLPLAMIASALLVSAGVGLGSYFAGSQVVSSLARQNLSTLANERASQLGSFVGSIVSDLDSTALQQSTGQAVRDFANGWMSLRDEATAQLVAAFVTNNSQDDKSLLDDGPSELAYSVPHSRNQRSFRAQAAVKGYSDIYLIDPKGNVIYSMAKKSDFAANVMDAASPLTNTGLGQAFAQANALETPEGSSFIDFAPYEPSGNQPSAFFAKPIFNAGGRKVGVLAFQVQSALVTNAVNDRTGLGETGEIVVVGPDHKLRSDSSFTPDLDVGVTEFKAAAIDTALAGAAGGGDSDAYRNMHMQVASAPVPGHTGWAVAAAMSTEEVLRPVADMRNLMLVIGVVLLGIVGVLSLVFSRSITKPLTRLTGTMERLAKGDYDLEVKDGTRSDEIGAMARTVEVFRENGQKVAQMTEAEAARIIADQEAREVMMTQLQQAFGDVVDAAVAGDFSRRVDQRFDDKALNNLAGSVNNLVETVQQGLGETGQVLGALANTDLTQRVNGHYEGEFAKLKDDTNAVANKLSEIVWQLKQTSGALKTATGEILSGANDLSERTTRQAATIEETSASMEQLAATVMDSAGKASDAAEKARLVSMAAEQGGETMAAATGAMERIEHSSNQISSIIGMIDDIAFQTNLLALNASVEAARAGEAGKGFAVVAIEVRRLAQSAAKASSDVKDLVERSVSQVREGSKLVSDASGKLTSMLDAVRQNNLLLEEIARVSRSQASSIDEVSAAVRQMDEMTQHNAALVEETNAAIEQTEAQASELDRVIDVFTIADTGARNASVPAPAPKATGIKGLQQKVKAAAASYLSNGNAAVKEDWSEF